MEEKKKEKEEKHELTIPVRNPPENELAERAVLGGMIVSPELIPKAHVEGLKEEDFYYPHHRAIYRLLTEVYDKWGEVWDDVVFFELAKKQGVEVSQAFFYALTEEAATGVLWEEALRIVKEYSLLRSSDDIAIKLLQAESLEQVYTLKEALESLLESQKKPVKDRRKLVNEELERIKRARESGELLRGIGTGFLDLDLKLLGLEGGQLIVIGARPGMGKSSLMLSMALRMARKHRVGIYSLEMSASQLVQRALSILSGVPLQNIRRGFINDQEWDAIVSAALEYVNLNLDIDDEAVQSVLDVKAKAKWYRYEVVFVDYLQLLKTERRFSTRQEEVAYISMSLKAMAKQLNIPVIALAQLNRGTESRSNKRPTLADLRESGQIEQDADVIMFLHRPEYYAKEKSENLLGRAELIIAKNRQGPTGTIELRFDHQTTGFYPADAVAEEVPGEEEDDIDIDF